MRQISILIVFLLLTSCEYFNVKKTSTEVILEEELRTFNWNEVDVYPSFSSCDSLASKTGKRLCFENTLTTFITSHLQQEIIVVTQDIRDTILLQIQVSEKGNLSILNIEIDSIVEHEIPNIKAIITTSLDDLPKIYPAIKRGQQVRTEFKMPIVIQAN